MIPVIMKILLYPLLWDENTLLLCPYEEIKILLCPLLRDADASCIWWSGERVPWAGDHVYHFFCFPFLFLIRLLHGQRTWQHPNRPHQKRPIIWGPLAEVDGQDDCCVYLIDWSCSCWRSSSEMVAKAPSDPLMGVVGADFFFWSEWSSSIVCAFTGVVLSSWQISLCFLCVWTFASPLRATTPLLKLNSSCPFPFPAIFCNIHQQQSEIRIQNTKVHLNKSSNKLCLKTRIFPFKVDLSRSFYIFFISKNNILDYQGLLTKQQEILWNSIQRKREIWPEGESSKRKWELSGKQNPKARMKWKWKQRTPPSKCSSFVEVNEKVMRIMECPSHRFKGSSTPL